MSLRIPEVFSSSSSLDLRQNFPFAESHTVLSESISLATLSTTYSDDVPPFPSGHSPPLATVISLWSRLSMFPLTLRKSCKFGNRPSTVYITVPTAPRLKTMLYERICVRKWTQSIVGIAAPGHVPWGEPEEISPMYWIPEGSSYSPETFQEALHSKRWLDHKTLSKVVSPEQSDSNHTSNLILTRDNLVFEREITLRTAGQTRRCSLQIPASSMDPELVDLMLELKHLSSFFQGESQDLDQTAESPEKMKNTLIPPTLMVSNSEISVPILLDSLGDSPPTLAVRRGKKVPAPLSFKPEDKRDPYSDIPTPFLGSPSTYSPKFEFSNSLSGKSMNFQDMIDSLRSQCAAIERNFTCDDDPLANTKTDASADTQAMPEEEDEWAFAAKLMETYGDRVDFDAYPLLDSEGLKCANSLPSESISNNNSFTDNGSESAVDVSEESPDTSLESIEPRKDRVDIPPQEFLQRSTSFAPYSRPSTPLPLRPALADPSSPNATQSFLKRCKSVRFASLPSRRAVPPFPANTPSTAPRRLTGTLTTAALRRPSPLRHSLAPSNETCRPRIGRIVSPPPKKASTDSHASERKPVLLTPTSTNTGSSKNSGTSPFSFRRSATRRRSTGSGNKRSPSQTTPPGRHSIGRLMMRTSPGKGKENKAGPLSYQGMSGWATLDENALRRGTSGHGDSRSETNKSRMPVPLRNILTRFK